MYMCMARIRASLAAVLPDMGPAAKAVVLEILSDIDQRLNRATTPEQVAALLHNRHTEFLARLAKEYPALTPTELRVCALIRSAVPSKDIAALLCCSVRSVEKHRERLRRKFNLSVGENLVTFLVRHHV